MPAWTLIAYDVLDNNIARRIINEMTAHQPGSIRHFDHATNHYRVGV